MPGIHTEDQLQAEVAAALVAESGWVERPAAELDKTTRLIPDDLFAFLAETQPKAVTELERRASASRLDWKAEVIEAVVSELDRKPGQVLGLLRHGKKILNVPVKFAYFQPAFGNNPDLVAKYDANRLTVVREAPIRKPNGAWGEVDIALCVNGIPVADAELKNSLTGTGVDDAIEQYKTDRDPNDTLLRYRSVVHFAVDSDDVYMTTAVRPDARFLPFNRGSEPGGIGGQGNYDPGDGSHKTSYLWRDVWQRDNWLDLLNRFIHTEEDPPKKNETAASAKQMERSGRINIVFPRYHQWDCVLKLEADVRTHGAGRNCLVQHSAGSGKSKTIGWTAHRLKDLHRPITSTKGVPVEERVFDKVVVITDRTVLDNQLTKVVQQFERKDAKGQVVHADTSKELADALSRPSVRIVVTTLQKFPFAKQLHVLETAPVQGGVAVLIDEAHSSQTGDSAKHMKEVLAAGSLEEAAALEDTLTTDEDEVEAAVRRSASARKRQSNISMFAFTATPKPKTRELFGTAFTDADGEVKYRPFHLYSMRQAIEEGFILDVLRNYTSYRIYYRLATESDELVEKSSAAATAKRYPTLHPHVLDQKVAILVEHFREKVAHKIGGQAKSMVVTRSRLHAVRYKQHIDAYIAKKGYTDLKALVAFSGKVTDPDVPSEEHTEPSLNGFPMSQTAGRFKGEPAPPNDPGEYQVLVVAEKYQTGFDAPLLHTMYVDKPLKDVAAVQTLGRLNRTYPLKEDTFVLDFVNEPEDIQAAFEPYYTTAVTVATHPQTLSETWQRVEDHLVIEQDDVDAFATVWFTSPPPQNGNASLKAALRPASERFAALDEPAQDAFRKALKQYIRLYAFLAQVLPYEDTDAEKNFAYAKLLAREIAADGPGRRDYSDLLELTHVYAKRVSETDIELAADTHEQYTLSGSGEGPLTEEEMVHISDIVERINEHHGAELGDEHRIIRKVIEYSEVVSDDATIQEQAVADQSDEAFALGDFRRKFEEAILEVAEEDSEFHDKVLNKPDLMEWMIRAAVPIVRRRASQKHRKPELPLGGGAAPEPA